MALASGTCETWDIVVVFERGKNNENDDDWKRWAKRFQGVGVEVYAYASLQRDEALLKLRAPYSVLEAWAEKIGYLPEYSPKALEALVTSKATEAGHKDWKIPPESSRFKPYKYQRGPFRADAVELFRARGDHPFGALHRARLLQSLIDAPPSSGGCGFQSLRRLSKGNIKGFLVLHDQEEVKEIMADFVLNKSIMPSGLDISIIADYFGARLGFVFSFRQHMTSALTPLALWGIVVYGISRKDVSNWWVASFAVIAAIWGVACLQLWRRVESTNRMKWVGDHSAERELARPAFRGDERKSPVDGLDELYYPNSKRTAAFVQNLVPMGLILAAFGASFYGTIVLGWRTQNNDDPAAQNAPAVTTAIYVQVLNLIYAKLAVALTNRENYRTDKEHNDSLTLKMSAFQLLNSFLPLYYTAFIRPHIRGGCNGNSSGNEGDACIKLLGKTLMSLYISQIIVSKVVEQLVPLVMNRYQRWSESRGKDFRGRDFSRAESELMLAPTDPDLFHVTTMTQSVVEFGYVTLFVFAFPLAPLLSWLNGVVSLRSTCHVMLFRQQRALPHVSDGLGSFNSVFDILAKVSVVTNAGLLVFAANLSTIGRRSPMTKVWIFIIIQYVLFTLQILVDLVVPDEPDGVRVQRQRGALFRKVVAEGVFPPNEDDDERSRAAVGDVVLHDTDDDAGTYEAPTDGSGIL